MRFFKTNGENVVEVDEQVIEYQKNLIPEFEKIKTNDDYFSALTKAKGDLSKPGQVSEELDMSIDQLKKLISVYGELVSKTKESKASKEKPSKNQSPTLEKKQNHVQKAGSKPLRYLESVVDGVLFISGSYNYSYLEYCDQRKKTPSDCLRVSIKKVFSQFSHCFLKVHSSYLVNPLYIVGYKKRSSGKDYELILKPRNKPKSVIPISRSLMEKELRNYFENRNIRFIKNPNFA